MMKNKKRIVAVFMLAALALTGCGASDTKEAETMQTNPTEVNPTETNQTETNPTETNQTDTTQSEVKEPVMKQLEGEITKIVLSDEGITVAGEAASASEDADVYVSNDIVFYQEGQDFTYGEGTKEEEHSQEEAEAHSVIHITKPGNYEISGQLSNGQIAVDLGDDAKEDENAVVNLLLNNVDITCTVAPAVIFYNVYECGESENPGYEVDTSAAGANVILADGSINNINGSHVAKIYEEVELNEAGTEVVDSKKLHKYDGAFYSKMSMNVYGENDGGGVLNITADNEGMGTELHLTIQSGNINITSGNDGINTNEDGVSVTTVNGGNLTINVSGTTGEGDGIDSNGWLVINGGTVQASACGVSADAGIDSDMGIYLNGGTVYASGNMLDQIAEAKQTYGVFQFDSSVKGNTAYSLVNENDEKVLEVTPTNDFSILIVSSPDMSNGNYSFLMGEEMLTVSGGMGGFGGKNGPDMMNGERPEGMEKSEGEMPEGMEKPEGERPEGMERPEGDGSNQQAEASTVFTIAEGANFFQIINR